MKFNTSNINITGHLGIVATTTLNVFADQSEKKSQDICRSKSTHSTFLTTIIGYSFCRILKFYISDFAILFAFLQVNPSVVITVKTRQGLRVVKRVYTNFSNSNFVPDSWVSGFTQQATAQLTGEPMYL